MYLVIVIPEGFNTEEINNILNTNLKIACMQAISNNLKYTYEDDSGNKYAVICFHGNHFKQDKDMESIVSNSPAFAGLKYSFTDNAFQFLGSENIMPIIDEEEYIKQE